VCCCLRVLIFCLFPSLVLEHTSSLRDAQPLRIVFFGRQPLGGGVHLMLGRRALANPCKNISGRVGELKRHQRGGGPPPVILTHGYSRWPRSTLPGGGKPHGHPNGRWVVNGITVHHLVLCDPYSTPSSTEERTRVLRDALPPSFSQMAEGHATSACCHGRSKAPLCPANETRSCRTSLYSRAQWSSRPRPRSLSLCGCPPPLRSTSASLLPLPPCTRDKSLPLTLPAFVP